MAGTGLSESLEIGGSFSQYRYRSGKGLISSAEWLVVFDDFTQLVTTNVPVGWAAAIVDAGGTVAANTTAAIGATGVITFADATASEGAAIYLPKAVQLTAGKKFFMEVRVRTNDVTDNAIQFGLTDLTAVVNPEDLWTTVAANLIAFGILDGSAVTTMLTDAGNSGTTAQVGSRSLVVDTWHVLGIEYNGVNLRGFVDGQASLLWSGAAATVPTGVALSPFIGHINGNGAGGNGVFVDYFRYAIER